MSKTFSFPDDPKPLSELVTSPLRPNPSAASMFDGLPRRGDVAKDECTRDPIFLLQRRSLAWRSEDSFPDGYERGDDGFLVREEKFYEERPWLARDDKAYPEAWSCKEFVDADQNDDDAVVETWHTESVWFTRAEAANWGHAHAYRFPEGWRVYCVCAEGELARLLKAFSLKPTGTREA